MDTRLDLFEVMKVTDRDLCTSCKMDRGKKDREGEIPMMDSMLKRIGSYLG
jgi:hypothetical protein